MTEADKEAAAKARYLQEAHRVQSGVAMMMNYNTDSVAPKHLRVGINMAQCETAAIVNLLIAKGICTRLEFFEALTAQVKKEADAYQKEVSAALGREVTLG